MTTQLLYTVLELLKLTGKSETTFSWKSIYSIRAVKQAQGTRQEGKSCRLPTCESHCIPHCLEKNLQCWDSQTAGKNPPWCTPGFKSPVTFCSKGSRNELSTALPGSVLSPLCDLCSLHPLWWAWFCCSTSHSTESAEFVSLPAQSRTPAGHQERKEQWTRHSGTLVS